MFFCLQHVIPAFLAFFLAVNASADIYRWRDAKGVLHYSDRRVSNAKVLALKKEYVYLKVVYVFDGDTVKLEDGRRIRLLNINAPEVESHQKLGEAGGEEAKRQLEEWILGKKVRLEYDAQRKDKYHRTLAYLFTESGENINVRLVRDGLAIANLHPPNLKFAKQLLAAQEEAESAGRGIWGKFDYQPIPIENLTKKKYRGWHRWLGKPRQVVEGRKYVRLKFAGNVAVVIPKANLRYFPPLSHYLHRSVEVRGWPSRRKGRYSILVRHPSDLRIL